MVTRQGATGVQALWALRGVALTSRDGKGSNPSRQVGLEMQLHTKVAWATGPESSLWQAGAQSAGHEGDA